MPECFEIAPVRTLTIALHWTPRNAFKTVPPGQQTEKCSALVGVLFSIPIRKRCIFGDRVGATVAG